MLKLKINLLTIYYNTVINIFLVFDIIYSCSYVKNIIFNYQLKSNELINNNILLNISNNIKKNKLLNNLLENSNISQFIQTNIIDNEKINDFIQSNIIDNENISEFIQTNIIDNNNKNISDSKYITIKNNITDFFKNNFSEMYIDYYVNYDDNVSIISSTDLNYFEDNDDISSEDLNLIE